MANKIAIRDEMCIRDRYSTDGICDEIRYDNRMEPDQISQ